LVQVSDGSENTDPHLLAVLIGVEVIKTTAAIIVVPIKAVHGRLGSSSAWTESRQLAQSRFACDELDELRGYVTALSSR
jgi:hypothetical protein